MPSRIVPTTRELLIAALAVLLALSLTNLVQPAAANGGNPTTDVVYIATGENFPDALGAAAAAGAMLAPVLLVRPDSVPAETLAELNRLTPERIVIVGGTAVVSDGVKATLEGLGFSPTVTRQSGGNRYATAAALSAATFPTQGLYPLAVHAGGDQWKSVNATGEVVRSVTLTAPVDGTVIANSSASVEEATAGEYVRCSISDSPAFDGGYEQTWYSGGSGGSILAALAGTRGFDVTAGQEITISLFCHSSDASAGVFDSSLTAIFVAGV